MGVLRAYRSDLFSLGFGWRRNFASVQGFVRVEDGGDTLFSGVDRVCDSNRFVPALSGVEVGLSTRQRDGDTTTWLNASAVGVGGPLLWPPEFRLKARVSEFSNGQRKAGSRSGSGRYRKTWPSDLAVVIPSDCALVWSVLLLDDWLAISTANLGGLAGMRQQEAAESKTWVWALRLGLGSGQIWALVFGPGLKQKLWKSPFSKGLGKI